MNTPALVNVIPPTEQLTIENVTLSKHQGHSDLDIGLYSGKCLGYLLVQFQTIDPGDWEKSGLDLLFNN